MLLGLLWILACVPVITFGAATTAMLLTAETSLHKDEGPLFRTFWKHFGKEFKEATILWLIQIPFLAVLAANVWLININLLSEIPEIILLIVSTVVLCWTQLWLGYLSKFDDSIKTVWKNGPFITINNFGNTLLMTLVIVATIVLAVIIFLLIPPILLLLPGAFILAYTTLLRKLLGKYIPKEDLSSPEETE